MSFVEWIFLLGGLAVAGPMIAHMLAKPRFRRVPFTMLRFLHSGQVESQSRRKLRDVLVLLLRCTIIVLIAMLFARPLLRAGHKPNEGKSVYCLGLDNSMSMAYSDGGGTYFDELVDAAVDYIRSADADGVFNVCSLASADWARGLSREQALIEVKGLRIAPGSADVADFVSGLGRANRAGLADGDVSVLVLSDFTPNTLRQFVGIAEPTVVDNLDYEAIVSSKPVDNAAITNAHVIGITEGRLTVNATVVNYGDVEQHRRLTVKAGSRKSAPMDISLLAGERRVYQMHIDTGAGGRKQVCLPVELSLSGGDGLSEDDTFYLAVSTPGHRDVHVLLIGDHESQMFLLKTAVETLSEMSPHETFTVTQVLTEELVISDLKGADVVVCSAISDRLARLALPLADFVRAGGRFVCFVGQANATDAADRLWRQDVLAALPGKRVHERAYAQARPSDGRAPGVDNTAARSLSNYRIDKVLLKGYLECEQHSDSRCLWRLQNESGFVYYRRIGRGASILVNTSADDSLGSLTKSNASVAFCRYLLGRGNQVGEHCFEYNERVTLPLSAGQEQSTGQKQLWVETCDGKRRRAATTDSFLPVGDPGGIGWVRTLGKQTVYAGVNLPEGETDMARPVAAELADVLNRVLPTGGTADVATAELLRDTGRRHLWKLFAWAIILLLLVESVVANRLKR